MFETLRDYKWDKAFREDHSKELAALAGWNGACARLFEALDAFLESALDGASLDANGGFARAVAELPRAIKKAETGLKASITTYSEKGNDTAEMKLLTAVKKELKGQQEWASKVDDAVDGLKQAHREMTREIEALQAHFGEAKKAVTGANDKHMSLDRAETAAIALQRIAYRSEVCSRFPWSTASATGKRWLADLKAKQTQEDKITKETGEAHHTRN